MLAQFLDDACIDDVHRAVGHVPGNQRDAVGIDAQIGPFIAEVQHNYRNGGSIHLRFFAVYRFQGEIRNRVFQDMRWAELRDLPAYNFLAADRKFIRDLAQGKIL